MTDLSVADICTTDSEQSITVDPVAWLQKSNVNFIFKQDN